MQEPDMRIDSRADFAIEFKDEAQHAMGGGMLGAEVNREVADSGFSHGDSGLERVANGEFMPFPEASG
jgi:hypothetical protein